MSHIGEDRIGIRIRRARIDRHVTQDDLARRAEISQAHLSMIESGERTPSADAVDAISRALGVSFDTDITGDGHDSQGS